MSTNQPPAGERPSIDWPSIRVLQGTEAAKEVAKGLTKNSIQQDNSAREVGGKTFDDSVPGGTILSPGLLRKSDLSTEIN